MISFVIVSFCSLEEKTMLAQVPELDFCQGFSKFFLYSFARELGRGRSVGLMNTCCICNSTVHLLSSVGIATESLGSQD